MASQDAEEMPELKDEKPGESAAKSERRGHSQAEVLRASARATLDEIEVVSHISDDYVYKSPSKMTSPEKKAFS